MTSIVVISTPVAFAALPATSNYELNSYGFGSGGTSNSTTPTYALEGITGETSGPGGTTDTYKLKPGYIETQQANVPKVTISNDGNSDKLHFVIDTQGNPTDALYAMQISTTSDFSGGNNYVKSDLTVGPTLTVSDYQTNATWSAGASDITGLSASTTYYLRAKATQGKYTESGWGPATNATTSSSGGPTISFCIYTGANCAAGGVTEAFGVLAAGTPANSPTNIGVDFATNASSGGNVYIYSANGGLASTSAGHTITSATANLGSASEGYGAQIASVTQTSGGPLTKVSPYDGTSNNVGILSTNVYPILSAAASIVGGKGAIQLQALASATTSAAPDYADTLTIIAAAAF